MTPSKRNLLAGIALALPRLVGCIVWGSALAQSAVPSNKGLDAAASIQGAEFDATVKTARSEFQSTRLEGPDFDATVKATQSQSQAVTRAATQTASEPKSNYARNLLQSDAFDKEIKRQSNQNSVALSATTPSLIEKVQKMLPKSAPYVGRLKSGDHVVVSQAGEEIIALIRSLVTSNPAERQSLLLKLQAFSESGIPEAMNFMGVIFEHGLFGAHPNMQRALAFYKSAAAAHYQPGVYNLALAAAYERDGASTANTRAFNLISKAASLGEESSYRVCGLGSFLSFRRNDQTAAVNFSKNCYSPLAGLPKASFNTGLTTQERVKLLRDSLSTGADDAYTVIERITRKDAATDQSFTYCKYVLLNRFRQTGKLDGIRDSASRCYRQFAKDTGNKLNDQQLHDQIVAGISGFVSAETAELKQIRLSNHFHYSWSVPYLPFLQADADFFEPLLSRAKP